jgi:hypothetical protein
MKSILVLLALIAVVAGIYFFFITDSAPYLAYKNFASALANGNKNQALQYADGPDVLGGPEEIRGQTAGGIPVDALVGVSFARESETKNSDGTVTVVGVESVRFDPPGTTSAMGALTAKYRQTAVLHKSGGRWLVQSFKDEFVEMRNWKGEKQ